MKKSDIAAFFSALAHAHPRPQSDLQFSTVFELLCAVLLSAQATDVSVNKATPRLFALAPTPAQMLALGEAGVADCIRSIGLYKTKAKHLIATCRILLERYDGHVPRDRTALESLPGVGRKTANVVLNVAFGEPTIAVDTHIFRVSNRTGLAPGNTPLAVERQLLQCVPEVFMQRAHHWLILLGRYTCKARKPACERCAVRAYCAYRAAAQRPGDLP